LNINLNEKDFGIIQKDEISPLLMIEYSSPNTNKTLHLGHIRNNLLGFSMPRFERTGKQVIKTNIVNDRGIIFVNRCMLGNASKNETPDQSEKG
jgi:arginyl-tRNA synthetase